MLLLYLLELTSLPDQQVQADCCALCSENTENVFRRFEWVFASQHVELPRRSICAAQLIMMA